MVIELKVNPMAVNNELETFLKDNNFNTTQFDILRFIGRHPRARFSYFVIAMAVGNGSSRLGEALSDLIDKDIISTEIDENGLATYGLYGDIRTCMYIYDLASLDWSEANALRKQLIEDTPDFDPLRANLSRSIFHRYSA